MSKGPLLHLFCCKNYQKQCYMEYHDGGKAFCKSMDGSFRKNASCRESKSIFMISFYTNKNKTLPSSMMKVVQWNQRAMK